MATTKRKASGRSDAELDRLRRDYMAFYLAMNPTFRPTYFQQEILAPIYEAIVRQDPRFEQTAMELPFRHSKSRMGTISFVPFYMGHHPHENLMLLCYGQKNDLYAELFPEAVVSSSCKAADEFATITGGTFYAGGFDTGINGIGANGIIIDDPHKSREEAQSEAIIATSRSVYLNTIETRKEPHAWMLINSSRFAPNDILGWRFAEDGAIDHLRGGDFDDTKPAEMVA